jgi:hypothetical protein
MEYRYFYDCIRIRGKEDELLIPLHAYPILNVIDFPRNLSFGNNPLCETITKVSFIFILFLNYNNNQI